MLRKDDWLSGYFEEDVYRLEGVDFPEHFPSGFIYAKCPVENSEFRDKALGSGFQIKEILLQFEQIKKTEVQSNGVQVGFAGDEEEAQIRKISGTAFENSRFYQDERISKETASRVKADWAGNFFRGMRGDHMVVAREKDVVVGFLQLINQTTIDLIAVSKDHCRKGIGAAMIGFANDKFGLLKAGTQLINQPSIQMYQKLGFLLKSAQYVFHGHFKGTIK